MYRASLVSILMFFLNIKSRILDMIIVNDKYLNISLYIKLICKVAENVRLFLDHNDDVYLKITKKTSDTNILEIG